MKFTREIVGTGVWAIKHFLDSRKIGYVQQIPELFPPVENFEELPENGVRGKFFALPGKRDFALGVSLVLNENATSVVDRRNIFCQHQNGSVCAVVSVMVQYQRNRCDYHPTIVIPTGFARGAGYHSCGIRNCDSKPMPPLEDGYLGPVRDELGRLSRI